MKFPARFLSLCLIMSMVMLPIPTQAGLIGTDRSLSSATSQTDIDKVREFVSRADVVRQFETLGIDAKTAQDRVNALTPEEINYIAGKIDTLPAGGTSARGNTVWWIVAAFIVAVGIWYEYK